jgi:hypothetical protein
MRKKFYIKNISVVAGLLLLLASCEKEKSTKDVSRITTLPEIKMTGGHFISFVKNSQTFEDPGAKAFFENESIPVTAVPADVDTSSPGVYIFQYVATSPDGLTSIARRVVAVTHNDVAGNDLTGKYFTVNSLGWPAVESTIKKIEENGLYEISDVLGYPGVEVAGEVVDLGNNQLVLLPGDSFLGEYGTDNGVYDSRNLYYSVNLLEEPYEGLSIDMNLQRVND